MKSLRGRESDELRWRICKIFLAFTLSCNFVSNNKGQKGRDYNPKLNEKYLPEKNFHCYLEHAF